MQMSEVAIDISGLDFHYQKVPVLENIELQVHTGEYLGIIGPNGGGKTTLLRLILGLLAPTRGRITVFGSSPHKAGRLIGYVPQSFRFDRKFPITVAQMVMMGNWNSGWDLTRRRQAAQEAMAVTDTRELDGALLDTLSGGQLQRVLIARALACQPKILILDEPTSNVDHVAERDILSLFQACDKAFTILMVSHDIGFISSQVYRVACLNKTLICHPTEKLSPDMFEKMYVAPVRHVQHGNISEHGNI